ncbi:NDR1/HIN1-like protein 3 [Argentina anserina]|uniref:NDR1/HIN1-like protein 3 n=1 Tax=Argentina anserina TaxID=57926 RepID=UPI0021765A3E|nr:NDR1/HIN1-like protein 3 [Potentilla anserina]
MTCSVAWNGNKLSSFTILAIVIGVAMSAGGITLLAIFGRSPELEVTVTNASMTQFNLNSSSKNDNNTLYYNLPLVVAIRNPSRTFSLHYNRIEVGVKYRQQKGTSVALSLPLFDQGSKNITTLHPVLQGQTSSLEETGAGIYSIDVQIAIRISRRPLTGIVFKPKRTCMLKVPSNSNKASPGSSFKDTQCFV